MCHWPSRGTRGRAFVISGHGGEPNLAAVVVPELSAATLVSFGAAALLVLRRKNGTR